MRCAPCLTRRLFIAGVAVFLAPGVGLAQPMKLPSASTYASRTRDSGGIGPEASASSTHMTPVVVGGIRDFAKSILQGDKAHKAWLLAAAEAFIAGKKVPKPPRLTPDQAYQRFGPQGACSRCDRRRKAEEYWHKD
jgi:hypothetical protein